MEWGSHCRDAPRSAGSLVGWGGDPVLVSFPDPGGSEEEKDQGSGEGPWSAKTDPSPGGALHPRLGRQTRVTAAPTPGSTQGTWTWAPPAPGRRAVLRLPPPPERGQDPSRAALLPRPLSSGSCALREGCLMLPGEDPATCSPPPHPRSALPPSPARPWHLGVRSLASPPLVLAGARGARRPVLPPPPPSSRAALFPVQQYSEGGTGGEHPSELPPGAGAAAARDNPRCPGFLSSLGRASARGAQTPPPSPAPPGDPGPHLAVSWRKAAEPGRWDERGGRRARFPSTAALLHPLSPTSWPGSLWGRSPPSPTPSQSVKAQSNLLGLNSRCSPYLCISVCFPVNWGQ